MFDIAWSELALIAVVALIVIGPKDLPRVMRNVGQWTRRARMMAAEFQRNLDDMVREAELDELKRDVQSISPAGFKAKVEEMIDVRGLQEQLAVTPAPQTLVTPTPYPAAAPPTTGAAPETKM